MVRPDILGLPRICCLLCLPGFPLPPTTTTKFYTLSFPPSRHKLGSRILVADSQPHCRQAHGIKFRVVSRLTRWKTSAWAVQGEGPEHISPDFQVQLPFFLQGLFTSSPVPKGSFSPGLGRASQNPLVQVALSLGQFMQK